MNNTRDKTQEIDGGWITAEVKTCEHRYVFVNNCPDCRGSFRLTGELAPYAWRNIKDNIPPNNEIILAYNGEETAVCKFTFSGDEYYFMLNNTSHQILKVTHWMWLPPIPDIQSKELINFYRPEQEDDGEIE